MQKFEFILKKIVSLNYSLANLYPRQYSIFSSGRSQVTARNSPPTVAAFSTRVESTGIEPATFAMRMRRSSN